jgi:hypothetical protein
LSIPSDYTPDGIEYPVEQVLNTIWRIIRGLPIPSDYAPDGIEYPVEQVLNTIWRIIRGLPIPSDYVQTVLNTLSSRYSIPCDV